jgi:hypothetical protein
MKLTPETYPPPTLTAIRLDGALIVVSRLVRRAVGCPRISSSAFAAGNAREGNPPGLLFFGSRYAETLRASSQKPLHPTPQGQYDENADGDVIGNEHGVPPIHIETALSSHQAPDGLPYLGRSLKSA